MLTFNVIKKHLYIDTAKLILDLLTTEEQFLRDISNLSQVSISVTANDLQLTKLHRDAEQLYTISELLGGKPIVAWGIHKEVMANHGHRILLDGNNRTYTRGEWTIRLLDDAKVMELLTNFEIKRYGFNVGFEPDLNDILIDTATS